MHEIDWGAHFFYLPFQSFQYNLSAQFASIAAIPAQSDGGVYVGRRQLLLDSSLQEPLVPHAAEFLL